MKPNDFLNNTTPAQRARIRAEHRAMAAQGFYPWSNPPVGFDKTWTSRIPRGLPTLELNQDGLAITYLFKAICLGEINSMREAASYLMSISSIPLTSTKLKSILTNQAFKGLLKSHRGMVKGQFKQPISEETFERVQAILHSWRKQR